VNDVILQIIIALFLRILRFSVRRTRHDIVRTSNQVFFYMKVLMRF